MAAPTLALSFLDFQVRVAEYLGIEAFSGGGLAVTPTDAHDLDLVKRIVNDGYRNFIRGYQKWSFLAPAISITFDPTGAGSQCVGSDPARYYLPDGFFGDLLAQWTYPSTGPRRTIRTVDESVIRQLWQNGQGGDPTCIAHRPLSAANANSAKTRFEAIVWPIPGSVYTITARGRIYPDKLSGDTDVTICGYQHDDAVLAHCLAVAERTRSDVADVHAAAAAQALSNAIAIDAGASPRRIGYLTDGSDGRSIRRHPYTGVDTYNDQPV